MARPMVTFVTAVCLALAFVGAAAAKERTVWRHDGGFFENTKGNEWLEKSQNGTFRFKEIKRSEEYIELENIKSANRVRLYDMRATQVDKEGKELKEYYKGKWEEQ